MIEQSTECVRKYCFRCVSWTPIFIGAIVGVGLAFLLNLFGIGIGLSAFTTSANVNTFAIGGFLGLAFGTIVASFVSGWVAGFLGKPYRYNFGVLYGFSAWCVALILLIILSGPTVHFVTHLTQYVTNNSVVLGTNEMGMNPVQPVQNNTATPAATPENSKDLAKVTFAIFALMFLGAISSCFGGHFGVMRRRKDEEVNPPTTVV